LFYEDGRELGLFMQHLRHECCGLRLKELDLLGRERGPRNFDRYKRHVLISNCISNGLDEVNLSAHDHADNQEVFKLDFGISVVALRINLDMDVLRTFAAGIELGSFSRAAERLGRSPSAISEQLKKLEQQAGKPLLRKEGRGLGLTPAGEALLGYARRILELNDEAVSAVRGTDVEGWVKIGMPQDFAETWLPDVLGQFKRAHPRVQVEARVERRAELVPLILAGQLDLALVWGEPAGSPYVTELRQLPMVWIGPASPHAAIREERDPLPLVVFERPCAFREAGTTALDAAGLPWRVSFTSPSLSGLWAAAAAGLGFTLRTPIGLPAGVAVAGEEAGLPPLPDIRLSLHRAEGELAPAAARLAGIIIETLNATAGNLHGIDFPQR
jgi:DNA-binding transcriptional LysR family regulator